MKVFGQLESAQAENLAADPTNLPEGRTWLNTSTNFVKTVIGGVKKVFVTEDQTQTLTNKTINADSNTITNIENADIKAGAAIDATKIADGSVSNTEFQYLDGVSSNIQTQITANATNHTNHLNDITDAHMASAIGNTPSGNLAATTVQGALNELQGDINTNTSAISAHTGASTGVHGVTGSVVGTSDAQVLTNKDIDGGTAANTRRITIPKGNKEDLDLLTRKEATLVYASDLDKLYVDDGTNLQEVGSGAGGETNFIANPDGRLGTTGWVTYKDAASSRPVDGTGGSPTLVSVTANMATTTITGDYSIMLQKTTGNAQGEGISYDFTIDAGYKAKVLKINKKSLINAGAMTAGSATADSDVIVYMYDRTNGVLIEPSSFKILSNSATITDDANYYFQTASNSTQYRLILHVATTNTGTYELNFQMSVMPSQYVYGTPITDWQPYTLTIGATTTAPTPGTSTKQAWWRRVGDSIDIMFSYDQTAAGSAGSGTYLFPLPTGLTIDSNKTTLSGNASNKTFGSGVGYNGSALFEGHVEAYDSTKLRLTMGSDSTAPQGVGSTFLPLSGTVVRLGFEAKGIPVTGFSSAVQMSETAQMGPPVLVSAKRTGALSVTTTPATIAWDTEETDNLGLFSTSTGEFTAHRRMDVVVNASALVSSTGQSIYLNILHKPNGGAYATKVSGISLGNRIHVNRVISLNAGDMIKTEIYAGTSTTALDVSSSGLFNWLNISEILGSQSIAASETITCKYISSAGGSIGTSATQQAFATKSHDSHSAFSGTTFTCPRAGKYLVTARLLTNSVTLSGTQVLDLMLYKNGSLFENLDRPRGNGSSANIMAKGETLVDLVAGDTLSIYASSSVATTQHTDSRYNVISITSQGF